METFAKQVSEVEPEISKTSSKKADSAKYRMRMAPKKIRSNSFAKYYV